MNSDDEGPVGMTGSMIQLGETIANEFPNASEKVGRAAIKAGVSSSVGHPPIGRIVGNAASRLTSEDMAKTVGAGIIGGVATGVTGLALTAALPFVGLYAVAKWAGKKLNS